MNADPQAKVPTAKAKARAKARAKAKAQTLALLRARVAMRRARGVTMYVMGLGVPCVYPPGQSDAATLRKMSAKLRAMNARALYNLYARQRSASALWCREDDAFIFQ